MTTEAFHDPYARCEENCNHDLAAGLTLAELAGDDGPNAPVWVLSGLGFTARALLGDAEAIAS